MFFKKKYQLEPKGEEKQLSLAGFDHKSLLIWAICIILFGVFYWKLRNIGPVILEDYFMITYTKSFFSWMKSLAVSQGRVSYFISCWLWAIAFFNYSLEKYQIIRMMWTALCLFSVWRLVRDLTNQAVARLSILISLIFFVVQIRQHDLLFSYPGFAHVPFSFMLLGLDTELRYLKSNKKRWMVLTVLLVFISGFCQEGFLLNFLMYAWMAFCVYYMNSNKNDWKNIIIKTIKSLIPIILTGVLILVIYIAWRKMHPGDYAGAEFSFISKKGILITWFTLMNGMFPLRTAVRYLQTYPELSLLNNIGLLDIFTAIISAVGVVIACIQVKKESALYAKKNVLILLGCALACALAPALHSLTASYVSQVLNGFTFSYTISFFCYFFIMVAIALIMSIVCHTNKIEIYKVSVCIFTVLVMFGSLVNSSSNNFALQNIQRESDANATCDAFFKKEENHYLCTNHTLYVDTPQNVEASRVFYSVLVAASDLGVGNEASAVERYTSDIQSFPENAVRLWYDGQDFHTEPLS